MMSLVLARLEQLQADLAVIDPTNEAEAADAIATIAGAVRKIMVEGPLNAHVLDMPHVPMRVAV